MDGRAVTIRSPLLPDSVTLWCALGVGSANLWPENRPATGIHSEDDLGQASEQTGCPCGHSHVAGSSRHAAARHMEGPACEHHLLGRRDLGWRSVPAWLESPRMQERPRARPQTEPVPIDIGGLCGQATVRLACHECLPLDGHQCAGHMITSYDFEDQISIRFQMMPSESTGCGSGSAASMSVRHRNSPSLGAWSNTGGDRIILTWMHG